MKKTNITMMFVLVCMIFTSINLLAQEKELQTESDGFRWYELKQGNLRGAQSANGVTFIPLSRGYTYICYHSTNGGWFNVKKNSPSQGACDITGKELVAPGRYDDVSYRKGDGYVYCVVKLNGKKGVCDSNGREIIAPKYDFVNMHDNEGCYYYGVKLNGKEGACDINGREIIAPRYESLIYCQDDFQYQDASGKWISTGVKLEKSNFSSYASNTSFSSSSSSSFSNEPTNAQTPWNKELHKESDGFQWYEYTYEKNSNGHYPKAAFDLNGKRLTCNCECYIIFKEEGFFDLGIGKDATGKITNALYDKYGNCVIPEGFGFTSILIYPEYELLLCYGSQTISGEYLFTMDGRYYVEKDLVHWTQPGAFSKANKKPTSTLGGGYYASNTSSSSSRSSNTSTSYSSSSSKNINNAKTGLLYKGRYNAGPNVYPNGTSFPDAFSSMDIEVYENKINILGYGDFKYQGNTNGGKRKYSASNVMFGFNQASADAYVDSNYNISVCFYVSGIGTVTKQYTTSGSPMPQNQGGYYGVGSYDNYNGGNTSNGSTGTTTQPKTHKCGLCNGTGRVINTDGTSFGNTKWCSECGKTVPDYHYHTTCPSCKGKGYW